MGVEDRPYQTLARVPLTMLTVLHYNAPNKSDTIVCSGSGVIVTTESRPVRVRFAPSPTGDLHIGGVRTAQFNWMFARRYDGKFILRIEDTDQKRTREQSLAGIMDGLRWAGLDWDEGPDIGGPFGPYIQSERLAYYQKWANWLVENGHAYRAYESREELELITKAREAQNILPRYDRRARTLTPDDWANYEAQGRKYVIRLKVPLGQSTTWVDMVRGPVTVNNDQLEDIVLLKDDGFPTYHLAHIIDDHMMEISHVLRAEEWIPSAVLHQIIYQAFGWTPPQFAHVPVILKQTGKGKMSKRDEGAAVSYFINGGYLPEAVTNFLCNVGWNYGKLDEKGEEVQVFTKEEAAAVFDITRVTSSGTRFDLKKLQWLNGEHIRLMDNVELAKRLRPYFEKAGLEVNTDVLLKVTPLVKERIKLLTDAAPMAGFLFVDEIPAPGPELLIQKGMDADQTRALLERAVTAVEAMPDFSVATQEHTLRAVVDELGVKPNSFFGPIRAAVTGQTVSPPLFETMEIMGREKVLKRLKQAIKRLKSSQPA